MFTKLLCWISSVEKNSVLSYKVRHGNLQTSESYYNIKNINLRMELVGESIL